MYGKFKYIIFFLSLIFTAPLPAFSAGIDLSQASTFRTDKDYKAYIIRYAPSENAFIAVQRLAERYIHEGSWEVAAEIFKTYKPMFSGMEKRFDLIINILLAPTENLIITELGPEINTASNEYHPNPTADGKKLYFNRIRRGNEDIFIAEINDDSTDSSKWKKAQPIGIYINTPRNEAIMSVAADEQQLILFGNYPNSIGKGDLFYSVRRKGIWFGINHFPRPVNSVYFESDGQLVNGGRVILFASDRPGGIGETHFKGDNYHGDISGNVDIYACIKGEDGKWGQPINLGSNINTPFSERTPFLHPDGKTLYFSSDGHYGLGRSDIFVSTRLSDTSWTEWSEPVNLGKEINTPFKDFSYKVSTNGEYAFFSKAGPNGDFDIYTKTLPKNVRPGRVVQISGFITDNQESPLEAEISVMNNDSGVVSRTTSIVSSGAYNLHLLHGQKYLLAINKKNYKPHKFTVDLTFLRDDMKYNFIDTVRLNFDSTLYDSLKIDDVRFFSCSDLIDSSSFNELDRLIHILNDNREFKIKMLVVYDHIGSEQFNEFLYRLRVDNILDYLISNGVTRNQIILGKGKVEAFSPNGHTCRSFVKFTPYVE